MFCVLVLPLWIRIRIRTPYSRVDTDLSQFDIFIGYPKTEHENLKMEVGAGGGGAGEDMGIKNFFFHFIVRAPRSPHLIKYL